MFTLRQYALVLERFFSRKERAKLFRSWAGSASMWIKVSLTQSVLLPARSYLPDQGGNAIWGNHVHAPDDDHNCTHSHGSFISFRPSDLIAKSNIQAKNGSHSEIALPPDTKNLTVDEAGTWILEHTPISFQVNTVYDFYLKIGVLTLRIRRK